MTANPARQDMHDDIELAEAEIAGLPALLLKQK